MKTVIRSILMFGASLALLGMSLPLYAVSDNSSTEFPAEGNVRCNDYALNGQILSMDTNNPVLDPLVGVVSGPENPADPDTTGESASYSITAAGSTASFFDSTTPVDYAILKSSREVRIFIYPSGGVTDDANMSLPSGNAISAFSLCYALGNEVAPPPPPPPPGSFPVCGGIDNVGVTCPADGSTSLVCNFELEDPNGDKQDFFGLDNENCCTCNTAALTECDPNLVADPITGTLPPGACPDMNLTEVPSGITGTRDPGTFFCITTGGSRRCYTR